MAIIESENSTTIRQAENRVTIEGIVKEIDLEARKTDKGNCISGSITIIVGDNAEVEVSTFAYELTKDKKSNRAYQGLQTIMNEYVSVAGLMKDGASLEQAMSAATRVRTGKNANMSLNEFYTENSELVSNVRFNSSYFRSLSVDECTPCAQFEAEIYIDKIRKESKDGEETGKIFVDAIIPMYNGVVSPFTFEADGDVAEYLSDNYPVHSTGYIWGEIISTVERTAVIKKGFGSSRTDETVTRKRALMITGGNEEPYDDENSKAYSVDAIKAAMKVREMEYLPSLLQKSKDKAKSGAANHAPGFRTDSGAPVGNGATPSFF